MVYKQEQKGEDMKNKTFQNTLKKVLTQMGEDTLNNLLKNDLSYQESSKKQEEAEKEYLSLDLTVEQREKIEKLLFWTDKNNAEYCSLNYLAGICDGKKLMNFITQ